MPAQLLPYLVAVGVITLTPGADTAIVIRNAIAHDTRAAVATALGSATGLLLWGAASAAGIAAVLAASATLFTIMKVLGALYLVHLGVQSWRHAGAGAASAAGTPGAGATVDARRAFRQLTNLSNPKAAPFFTALLPQSCAAIVPRFGDVLRRPRVARRIDRISGTVLIALGVRVALERR